MSASARTGMSAAGTGDNVLDEAKAFKRGKGRMIAAMIGAGLAAAGVLTWYTMQGVPDSHRELGKQVNGLRALYFDGFMACALPGKRLDEIKSDADLRIELHGRGSTGARYGAHLRDKCTAPLRELDTRLRTLNAPPPLAEHVRGMSGGSKKMATGLDSYSNHLTNLAGGYDEAAAEPTFEPLVRGWYEFRRSHAELNRVLRGENERD